MGVGILEIDRVNLSGSNTDSGNRSNGNYTNADWGNDFRNSCENFRNSGGNRENGYYGQRSGFRDRNVLPLRLRQLMVSENIGARRILQRQNGTSSNRLKCRVTVCLEVYSYGVNSKILL